MKGILLRLRDQLANSWAEFRYDTGIGPAPWSDLWCIKTIESDGPLKANVYRCLCRSYLIDIQNDEAVPPTIALVRSQDLDEILELLREARLAISLTDLED